MIPRGSTVEFIFIFVFYFGIPTLVGAIMLRTSVWFFNKMADSPDSPTVVPKPTIVKALGIACCTPIVSWVTWMIVNFLLGICGISISGELIHPAHLFLAFPIIMLVKVGILVDYLPTTSRRAILIILCQYLIAINIVGTVVLINAIADILKYA